MSINKSKAKGARCELLVKKILLKYSNHKFEKTPLSGALGSEHGLKGDLYIPKKENLYTIEVKCYKDEHFDSKILTNKSSEFLSWWKQCKRESDENENKPMLIFKKDRGKWLVAVEEKPICADYIYINATNTYVCIFEDFLDKEDVEWVK